jgi:hypothetical protein
MSNIFTREQRIGKRLMGAGAALLFAALLAPEGAADFDAAGPHPCNEPWAAAGNHGGKIDRHHVARQAAKYCTAERNVSAQRDLKEAANVPQADSKPVLDR